MNAKLIIALTLGLAEPLLAQPTREYSASKHSQPDPYLAGLMFRLFEMMTPAERTEKVARLATSKDASEKNDAVFLLSSYFYFMEEKQRLELIGSLLSDSDAEIVVQMLSGIHDLPGPMIPLLKQVETLERSGNPRVREAAVLQAKRIREAREILEKDR